jgi:hypothetical protein
VRGKWVGKIIRKGEKRKGDRRFLATDFLVIVKRIMPALAFLMCMCYFLMRPSHELITKDKPRLAVSKKNKWKMNVRF